MKTTFLKPFVKIASIIAIAYGIYTYACVDDGGEYTSTFSPEIALKNDNYTPLFFDDYTLFYNGANALVKHEFFQKENVKDWKKYLDGLITEKALNYYLYNEEVTQNLDKWAKNINEGTTPNLPYKVNTKNQKIKNFFTFLKIARGSEKITNQTYDYWNYDEREKLIADEKSVQKIEDFYNKTSSSDTFFKNRIWFQTIRIKFYSSNRASVIDFFNKTAENQPKNSLYYRALNYVSGAYKSLKNYTKNNIILAKIFNEYPILIHSAVFEYRPLKKEKFQQTLKGLSRDDQDALWAMQGYYGDEFLAMQSIYKLNPHSKNIDFLLTRYINKLEDIDSIKNDNTKNQWIVNVAKENKIQNPYLWDVASGYLSTLSSNYQQAEDFFKKAKELAQNTSQKKQVRLLNLHNEISRLDKIDEQDEIKLTEDLKWLMTDLNYFSKDKDLENLRFTYLQSFAHKRFSKLYTQKGDKIRAELTKPNQEFYKNLENSMAMEKFMLRKDISDWDKIWLEQYPHNLGDIHQYRAILAFYNDDIDKAIEEVKSTPIVMTREFNFETNKYKKIPYDYKNSELLANPFNGKIKDCADCDHRKHKRKKKKYTVLSVLETIKKMQTNIKNEEDIYNNALLVGNAFYNMSYYGNGRKFYYNNILDEYSIHISNKNKNLLMVLGMHNAKKYYTIAKNHAKNNEQRAKITYLLAKVERNEFYTNNNFTQEYYYPYDKNNIMFKEWQGFKELKDKYSDTKYYQEVLKECGYFRKYIQN